MSSLIATPLLPYKKIKEEGEEQKNEQNMPEEPLENRHKLESEVEKEKGLSKKKTKPKKQNWKPNYCK